MASVDVTGASIAGNIFVSGAYLSAYDTGNYSIGAAYQLKTLQFGTTTLSSDVTLTGVNNTDITFSSPGIYNIAFSVQVTCNTPQAHLFYLWLCLNGSPVANTNSVVTIHGTHGGNNGHSVAAWNFLMQVSATDKLQICWSADNTAIAIQTIPSPAAGIPISPAAILSVTQS